MKVSCVDLGCRPYEQVYDWQLDLAERRKRDIIGDHLLLVEHPPVVTFGKRDSRKDLLVSPKFLSEKGIAVFSSDRGGKITYHGPGQMVAYFVLHLRQKSIPEFVRQVEEVLIRVLDRFQIRGERDESYPGVWVEHNKIAAVGFHVDRQVTTHGIALNVNCDLTPFRYFHPCGIPDRGVTSLDKELGWHTSLQEVKSYFLMEYAHVFQSEVVLSGGFSSLPE